MYEYRAKVTKVHDGDTVTVSIDLGLDVILVDKSLRLNGINAPEMNTPQGKVAQKFLENILLGKDVLVKTYKDKTEKYGRYLADVAVISGDHYGEWVSKVMVDSKQAVPWDGKGQRPTVLAQVIG